MTPETFAKMITAYMRAYEVSKIEQANSRRGGVASAFGYRTTSPPVYSLFEALRAGEKAAIAASAEGYVPEPEWPV